MRWFSSAGEQKEQIVQIPVQQISINPYQPRKTFEKEKLVELAESIREVGLLQPIVVRKLGSTYELIAGERRWQAAKLAGLETIPGIVKADYSDKQVAQAALIENIQREDLNPLEEAMAYQRLINEFGTKQEELALQVGKSQSTIANKLRLLNLSSETRDMLGRGELNERQARALLKVKVETDQIALAKIAVENGLNVKQTEEIIERHLTGSSVKEVAATAKPLRKFVPKDIRIFLNTIKQSYKMMQQAGIKTELAEEEHDDHIVITVKILKR